MYFIATQKGLLILDIRDKERDKIEINKVEERKRKKKEKKWDMEAKRGKIQGRKDKQEGTILRK